MPATPLTAALPGRRGFVTGGGSGLGLAIATLLARDGWAVGLLDRDAARLDAAAGPLRAAGAREVRLYVADVVDEAAFAGAVRDFAAAAGGLDFLANNAGVAVAGAVEATPIEDWRWILATNVVGVAIGSRAALPIMRDANAGRILNVASAASFASSALMSAYNASKAAVVALTETIVQETVDTPIRATVAMPGFFPTHLLDEAHAPPDVLALARRLMQASRYTAERAAADILAAVARGDPHVVVPREYALLWRLKRLAPGWVLRWLPRAAQRRLGVGRGGGSTART